MSVLEPARWVITAVLAHSATHMSEPPTMEVAWMNAEAAEHAATPDFPAKLLLAIAHHESRFDPTALGSKGHWPYAHPPDGWGSFHCGVTQVDADGNWDTCLEMRDLDVAYMGAIAELNTWRDSKTCRWRRDRTACALAGYRTGNAGARSDVARATAARDLHDAGATP